MCRAWASMRWRRTERAARGSGIISVNGAAARKAAPGDLLIIASYGTLNEVELERFEPRLVHVVARNRIVSERCGSLSDGRLNRADGPSHSSPPL